MAGMTREQPDDDMNNLEFFATMLAKHGPMSRRDLLMAHQLRKGAEGEGGKLRRGYGSSYFAQRGGFPGGVKQYASGPGALWLKNDDGLYELTAAGQEYAREDKFDIIDVYMVA